MVDDLYQRTVEASRRIPPQRICGLEQPIYEAFCRLLKHSPYFIVDGIAWILPARLFADWNTIEGKQTDDTLRLLDQLPVAVALHLAGRDWHLRHCVRGLAKREHGAALLVVALARAKDRLSGRASTWQPQDALAILKSGAVTLEEIV